MSKKFTSIVLALVMVLSIMIVGVASVSAATIVQQGSCGDNVTYTLDDSGLLTISGTGAMKDYYFTNDNPFYNNTEIREVVIEDGVTSIGYNAFGGCTGLTSVTIPDSVTHIYDSAFEECTGLTSVTIPDSVTIINNAAFLRCAGLTSITIGNSVTSIGDNAFSSCIRLTSVTIPDSVTSIGDWAFSACTGLTSITLSGSMTSIGESVFHDCKSLTSVTIPDSVTLLSSSAFRGCNSLASITIPDSITTFGSEAFKKGYSNHTNVYTSNQLAIDYFLNEGFHHSILGEYYVNYDEPNMIMQSGGSKDAIVTLDYDTANLKVTVPTVLPVNVDSNNNVTVADNAQISNLSNGSVDVTNAEIQTDEWSVVGFNTDFTKVPVGTKQYGFKLNGDDVSDGINTSVFNVINGNDRIGLSYDANVAIQSQPITNEDIGRIVFTVAWHK